MWVTRRTVAESSGVWFPKLLAGRRTHDESNPSISDFKISEVQPTARSYPAGLVLSGGKLAITLLIWHGASGIHNTQLESYESVYLEHER